MKAHTFFCIIKKAINAYGLEHVLENVSKVSHNEEEETSPEDFKVLLREALKQDLSMEIASTKEKQKSKYDNDGFHPFSFDSI